MDLRLRNPQKSIFKKKCRGLGMFPSGAACARPIPPALLCDVFFLKIGSPEHLLGLVSNHDPPDLCLLSS
jgi:hypothetical protein